MIRMNKIYCFLVAFFFVFFSFVVFASSTPGSSYLLNDFVVRSLTSSIILDNTKTFSIGVGYKRFSNESFLLAGFRVRFSFYSLLVSGYSNVIVPVNYIFESDFLDGWWQKIWLDSWLSVSF